MIDTLTGLYRAILERPHDDDLRLVLADALEESGDPERAELIRVQMELHRASHEDPTEATPLPSDARLRALVLRKRDLLRANACRWNTIPRHVRAAAKDGSVLYRRGFIDRVACRMEFWLAHGAEIVASVPVTEVVITDREPDHRNPKTYVWWDGKYFPEATIGAIPAPIWALMQGEEWPPLSTGKGFDSRDAALQALGTASLTWARGEAGLPVD